MVLLDLTLCYSTDEQAPIPDVFDQLIHRMSEANQGVDMIFNCQMGYVVYICHNFVYSRFYTAAEGLQQE
jgi:hypothetical protein